MINIQWKSREQHDCVLTIDNNSEEVTNITPSANPFVTDCDKADDLFTPIRKQTGKIEIVAELSELEALIGKNPIQRPVTLSVDDSVAWVGFLQSTTYSQPWDCGKNKVVIPVVSPLAILDSFKPSNEDLGFITFSKVIYDLCYCFGSTSPFNDVIFPNISNIDTAIKYQFLLQNYATWNRDEKKWDMASYSDILTDICKVFGWQCIERGDSLCFLAADGTQGYKMFSIESLIDDSPVGSTISNTSSSVEINGANHTIDYLPGKKKVTVEGDCNKADETLFSLNASNLDKNGAAKHANQSGNDVEVMFTRSFKASDEIEVLDNTSIKYENFYAQEKRFGGTYIASDRLIKYNNTTYSELNYDSGFQTYYCCFWKRGAHLPYLFRINPRVHHYYSEMTKDRQLYIKMNMVRREDYDSEATPWSGRVMFKVKIGDTEIFNNNAQFKGGNLVLWGANALGLNGVFHITIPANVDGAISVELTEFELGFIDFLDCYMETTTLEVGYDIDWTSYDLGDDREAKNKKEATISDGFTEEYSVKCGLTTYNNNEYGYGFIFDSERNYATNLYDGKSAEKALCDRLYNYYKQTRKRITAQVKSEDGKMLSMSHPYTLGNETESFSCTSQSVDWRNDTITATFNEIPQDDEQ